MPAYTPREMSVFSLELWCFVISEVEYIARHPLTYIRASNAAEDIGASKDDSKAASTRATSMTGQIAPCHPSITHVANQNSSHQDGASAQDTLLLGVGAWADARKRNAGGRASILGDDTSQPHLTSEASSREQSGMRSEAASTPMERFKEERVPSWLAGAPNKGAKRSEEADESNK